MRQFIRKNIWAVAPVVFVLVALVLLGSPLSSSKVQETPAEDDNLIVVGVSQANLYGEVPTRSPFRTLSPGKTATC